MAFCSQCGNEIAEGASFCGKCGTPVGGGVNPNASAPQQAYYQAPAAPQKGPLSKAWEDFKGSPSKFMITLKLALFQFLPGVGSLALNGYALTWGKEQALGKSNPMPTKIVRPGVFDSGLYVYGASLIIGFCVIVLSMILSAILGLAHLGWLASLLFFVFNIFFAPFVNIAYFRSALCGKVRAGLNLKAAWDLFSAKGKMGKFMGAYWAVNILVMLILFLVFMIFISIAMGVGVMSASSLSSLGYMSSSSLYYSYAPTMVLSSLISIMFALLPLVLILGFACFFVATMGYIITIRAFGYCLEDTNPAEWPEYQEAKQRAEDAY